MRAMQRQPHGSAAAEFVLLLPVLLTVILGTIDWGWYFTVREVAVNASREGARTASLLNRTAAEGVTRANQYLTASGLCQGDGSGAASGGAAAGNVRITVTCSNVVLTRFFPEALVPRTLTVATEMQREGP